jgi:hypothetical protein
VDEREQRQERERRQRLAEARAAEQEAQAQAQAQARAQARARARAERLEQALKEKIKSLKQIVEHPANHQFKDWLSSTDSVIFTTRQLIDRNVGDYKGLLLDLLENAVLGYIWQLNTLSHGKPSNFKDAPETQTAEHMIPGVVERMDILVSTGEVEYQEDLKLLIRVLQKLHGRPQDNKMVETIQDVSDCVHTLIHACRVRRK